MTEVCAYAVSSSYGVAHRYLYFFLLIMGAFWHKRTWIAEAILGGAMIYSSVTAVHSVALFSKKAPPVADLDAVPIYAVMFFGLCQAPWVVMKSKNFRREDRGARTVVFMWMFILMVGGVVSTWNIRQLHLARQVCESGPHGRMRRGQPEQLITFPTFMDSFLGRQKYAAIAPVLLVPITIYISERKRLEDKKRGCCACGIFRGPFLSFLTYFIPAVCFLWKIYILYITQRAMRHMEVTERIDSVGQWGPLVGSVFAVGSAIVVRILDGKDNPKNDVEYSTRS